MSFGPALALGILSLDEYLDIVLVGAPASDRLVALLNHASPQGLEFAAAAELAEGDPGLCRVLTRARYVAALSESLLSACGGSVALEQRIESFRQERHHWIVRETPRKIREIDIRAACESLELGRASDVPLLVDAGLPGDAAPLAFTLNLAPNASARPAELLEALLLVTDPPCPVVRVGLLAGNVSPLDLSGLRKQFSERRRDAESPDGRFERAECATPVGQPVNGSDTG
jgi:hypothetical protein